MRPQGWDTRLAGFVRERKDLPFVRGEHDCCLFAADWVYELTGTDYAAGLRGCYSDTAGAEAILAAEGGLVALVTRLLGDPCLPAQARRGDIVAVAGGLGALGICLGARSVFVGHDRCYYLPTMKCAAAWRVE